MRTGHVPRRARLRGQSMVEFIIVTPVMFLLVFGALQFALIYQAKTTLNYATFEAARAGALNKAQIPAMQNAFARAMAAMYMDIDEDAGVDRTGAARDFVRDEIIDDGSGDPVFAEFQLLNPNIDSFAEHGIAVDGNCEIPNDNLMYRDSTVKGDQNIQDANLLKLRVVYCYPLHVPFINRMLTTIMTQAPSEICPHCIGTYEGGTSIERTCLTNNRFPINAQAIVRMHSPATRPGGCP
ncbi:MAG: TadE/TadG family type IV pilus assembly protein [Gammaproteobacteria bacterium]